ncbi:hypothetical protein A3B18_02285 [Candidatus Giovannonibacteria bacterium RIFCSPLOWO2_01_FULL_46_13]|uniref:Uncharacterized protein n=1 Tax=Candidatus Giovannonibacteria bacterium RIFCSPLOWO2_01_FULL_46_13 TaxID=1798352 RepID=A0A1F5X563_9BACT|nr:MAG: hypothetical protein A3B18_02285 [Candidatus Giovannonibacteria bacterium RIFCSPLOWO2_01_FULL_46_13]
MTKTLKLVASRHEHAILEGILREGRNPNIVIKCRVLIGPNDHRILEYQGFDDRLFYSLKDIDPDALEEEFYRRLAELESWPGYHKT